MQSTKNLPPKFHTIHWVTFSKEGICASSLLTPFSSQPWTAIVFPCVLCVLRAVSIPTAELWPLLFEGEGFQLTPGPIQDMRRVTASLGPDL
uniref:Uncharacterized protein n=1 Tax=Hordeum vulgare subsp. vulgare TaxID=112509 RepID=A0A8I6WPN9_HORVV